MTDSKKVVRLNDSRAVEAQAAAWIARLDSENATADDARAFAEWKAERPQHREAADRLMGVWSEMDVLATLAPPLARAPRSRWSSRPKDVFGLVGRTMAAAAAVAAVAALLFSAELLAPKTQTYETVIGQRKTINLADGSSIELNTNSKLEVRYSARARDLRLTRGEAYFDVAPDKARPFSVYANDSVVRAVGTGFVVRIGGDRMEVTVSKGVVQLSSLLQPAARPLADMGRVARKPVAMVAAERTGGERAVLHLDDLERVSVPSSEMAREQSWRQDMLVFQGEALSDVIAEVSRYTQINIEIADPAIQSLKIGGYFRVGEVEPMLDALESGFGIRVERIDASHVRLSAGP